MALINIDVPQFPNVPFAAGVPAVLRNATNSFVNGLATQVNDALGVQLFSTGDTWGLFTAGGAPVITAQSVKSVEIEAEYNIPSYRVENGGFADYNKVQRPKEFVITFMQGGKLGDRSLFLGQIDAAVASLALLTLVTPEVPYASVNPLRYTLRREATKGKTLLAVEVHVREVRIAPAATLSSTATPAGASTVQGGAVAPMPPTAAVTAAVVPKLLSLGGLQ